MIINIIMTVLLYCIAIMANTIIMMNPMVVTTTTTAYVIVSPKVSGLYPYGHHPTTTIAASSRRYDAVNRNTAFSHNNNDDDETNNNNSNIIRDDHRRSILQQMTTWGSVTTTTWTMLVVSQPANAASSSDSNRLFQSNTILTNPILEQLRIWEQAEADNIKYNGELERGDAGNKGQITAYPSLLLPILTISQDISYLYLTVLGTNNINNTSSSSSSSSLTAITMNNSSNNSYQQALQILSNRTTYETINFKRIFNAYADNVYYRDPDRANLYLGGGGTLWLNTALYLILIRVCVALCDFHFGLYLLH